MNDSASHLIRCVEMVELMTDWMEGELPEGMRAHIEEHLAVCVSCGAYVAQLRQSVRVMAELDGDAPPAAAREALLRAFRSERS